MIGDKKIKSMPVKEKKIVNTISIDLYDDNTSQHRWNGGLDLRIARNVLQTHANLISETIGQLKAKQDDDKIKVFQPGQMPKANVQ